MPRYARWVLGILLMVQASLLSYGAWIHSPTVDETGHLAAGISHLKFGRFELYAVNPPLVRTLAAAPVVLFVDPEIDWSQFRPDPKQRSEFLLGRSLVELNGERTFGIFFLARLACIPIVLAGLVLCYVWARDLFGVPAGLVAATLWCFSPTVLGYGGVITPDLATAVFGMGALYAFWRWMSRPSWLAAVFLGLAIGLAMLTKSLWLLLPPLLVVFWAAVLVIGRRRGRGAAAFESSDRSAHEAGAFAGWKVQLGQLAAACLIGLLLVNAFYGFEGSFKTLGSFQFVSSMLTDHEGKVLLAEREQGEAAEHVGNRFAGTLLGRLPVPLPAHYLHGIDAQRRDFERGAYDPAWKSYLAGTWQQGGWWYYYVAALLLKVPLAFWLLLALALLLRFSGRVEGGSVLAHACVLVPAAVLLVLVSANTGLNRYFRYALPILPLLFIWTAQVGRTFTTEKSRPAAAASAVLLGWFVLSGLWISPHWLSYFSPVAGGPAGGHELLVDSNIDWGQDLRLLKDWIAEHPEAAEDFHLAFFGSYDPSSVGVEFRLPAPLTADAARGRLADQLWMGPQPGWYAVSVNYLQGHPLPVPDGSGRFRLYHEPVYEYFKHFQPIDRVGYSIYIYKLSREQVNAVREHLGLAAV